MRRISSILMALILTISMLFSLSACDDGGELTDDPGINEPVAGPTVNKLPLLTGIIDVVSGDSYKTIDDIKYRVSSYSVEKIGIAEAEEYPKLSEVLTELSSKRLADAKAINKLFKARAAKEIDFKSEDYKGEHFSYNVINSITRSDKQCFSFLETIRSYSGDHLEGEYSISHNLNPKTGEEYEIDEVITDSDALIKLTSDALYERYEELDSEFFPSDGSEQKTAIIAGLTKSFFKKKNIKDELGNKTEHYSPSWVFTGQGLSLIFDVYTIAPYSAGNIRVDFTYSELNGIIDEKFISTSETYVMPELFNDGGIAFDYDHDGRFDEVEIISKYREEDSEEGTIIDKVTVKKDDLSITRDCGAYSIKAYAVHMSDGSDYLYICCNKSYENYILIFNITGDYLEYIGRQSGCFALGSLTNPSSVYLAERINLLSTYDGIKSYRILNNGKFTTEDAYFEVRGLKKPLVSMVEISLPIFTGEDEEGNLKNTNTFPVGTEFEAVHTDGRTFVDLKEKDGELIGRFYVTAPESVPASPEEQYFRDTGEAIKDVFEELYFAD